MENPSHGEHHQALSRTICGGTPINDVYNSINSEYWVLYDTEPRKYWDLESESLRYQFLPPALFRNVVGRFMVAISDLSPRTVDYLIACMLHRPIRCIYLYRNCTNRYDLIYYYIYHTSKDIE